MKSSLKSFEGILDKIDCNYLLEALAAIDKLLETHRTNEVDVDYKLGIVSSNPEKILPIARDTSEKGIWRSFHVAQYSTLFSCLASISSRKEGFFDRHPDLPWNQFIILASYFKETDWVHQTELLDKLLIEFIKDLPELYKRIQHILMQAEREKYLLDEQAKKLFNGVKFEAGSAKIAAGLAHLRRFSEHQQNQESLQKLERFFEQLSTCDPNTAQGCEAIIGLIQVIGEIIKNFSTSQATELRFLPLKQLKDLRDKIGHAWDFGGKTEALLIALEDHDPMFANLQQELLDFRLQLKQYVQQAKSTSHQQSKQSIDDYWDHLIEPSNPLPYLNHSLTQQNQSATDKLLAIFRLALPEAGRDSTEAKRKLAICQCLFLGEYALPRLEQEIDLIFGTRNIQGNIEKLLLGVGANLRIASQANRHLTSAGAEFANISRSDINEWHQAARQLLQYPTLTQHPLPSSTTIGSITQLLTFIDNSPRDTQCKHYPNREARLLWTLFAALQRINQHTKQLIANSHYEPSEIRQQCRQNLQYHAAVLFNFSVIGECIQNLKEILAFRHCASLTLRLEFESLRWIRNAIMHDNPIDEAGSLLQYLRNDMLSETLLTDAGRAYDSDVYLQWLKNEIEQLIENIRHFYDPESLSSDIFAIPNDNIGAIQPSTASNDAAFYRQLLIRKLRKAIKADNHKLITILLTALEVDIIGKAWYSPYFTARDYLKLEDSLSLEDIYRQQQKIVELANRHGLIIKTLFGDLAAYANDYKDWRSGLIVQGNSKLDLVKLALFKAEMHQLLGKQLFIVTEDDVKEYFTKYGKSQSEIAHILAKLNDQSFEAYMNGMALFLAVEARDIQVINQILQRRPLAINLKVYGYPPLHAAANDYVRAKHVSCDLAIVELLLKAGADPNQLDKHGKSQLHYAAQKGNFELLNLLLRYKANPQLQSKEGKLALQYAIEYDASAPIIQRLLAITEMALQDRIIQLIRIGDIEQIANLLNTHAIDLNQPASSDEYPLHVSATTGNLEMVKLLIANGAKVDQRDQYQAGVLHYAADPDKHPSLKIVNYLLAQGAPVDLPDSSGQTPLFKACYCRSTKIAAVLLAAGANPNHRDDLTQTPLIDLAHSYHSNRKMMQLLICNGADLTLQDDTVGNVLHYAADIGNLSSLELLIKFNIDLYARSNGRVYQNLDACQIAERLGHHQFASRLRQARLGDSIDEVGLIHSAFGRGSHTARKFWQQQLSNKITFFTHSNENPKEHIPTSQKRMVLRN